MYLLHANVDGILNFEDNKFKIDYTTDKRVNNDEVNESVTRIKNSFYKLNTLSITGINASGKTTALNIIKGLQEIYLNNESLKTDNSLIRYLKPQSTINVTIYDKDIIYYITSTIINDEEEVYFKNETIKTLKVTSKFNKKTYKNLENYSNFLSRETINNDFLKKEDSIFSSILNKKKTLNKSYDLMKQTNLNFLGYFIEDISSDFVKLLDSSIEEFDIHPDSKSNDKTLKFEIKFKGNEEYIHSDLPELEDYLSSGTIKGLNILANVTKVLNNGGYLIIDEIENHLNKRIVQLIIELFTGDLNYKGATLIFSTHYVEILDSIDRSDSIYVLQKKYKPVIKRFSELLGDKDRNDKKKSDMFLSGLIDTMPTYKSYVNIKNVISKSLNKGDKNE